MLTIYIFVVVVVNSNWSELEKVLRSTGEWICCILDIVHVLEQTTEWRNILTSWIQTLDCCILDIVSILEKTAQLCRHTGYLDTDICVCVCRREHWQIVRYRGHYYTVVRSAWYHYCMNY